MIDNKYIVSFNTLNGKQVVQVFDAQAAINSKSTTNEGGESNFILWSLEMMNPVDGRMFCAGKNLILFDEFQVFLTRTPDHVV